MSTSSPLHGWPPYCGCGLLHALERVFVFNPFPQEAEHSPHSLHCVCVPHFKSTGHSFNLHSCESSSVASPTHCFPLNLGSGFVHDLLRVLFCIPLPQLSEHVVHLDHALKLVQPPLIGHGGPLHESLPVFKAPPLHNFPPYLGVGLLHDLVRVLVLNPVPQEAEHAPH